MGAADAAKEALSAVGQLIVKAAYEGIKVGVENGKNVGNIPIEAVKGAAGGVAAVAKSLAGKE